MKPKIIQEERLKKNQLKNKSKSGIKDRFNIFKFFKSKSSEEIFKEALEEVKDINDKNVHDHREDLLKGARKFIYPLGHSKHRLVRLSIYIFILAIIAFSVFCSVELYVFQSTSGFMYTVSEVIPFPVATVGNDWVYYKNYLFELRRNMHYYESQQDINFNTPSEKAQLINLKQQAMNRVIEDQFVSILASKNNVKVSSSQVNNEIKLLQEQNKLGSSTKVLSSVLSDYWGWNINDFKRELSLELLQQAVVSKLDTKTNNLASSVYKQLINGGNFASLATQYSNDLSTKNNGGQYPNPISINDTSIDPQVINELTQMKVGQISPPINTGYSLEILKLNAVTDGQYDASHIQFNFEPISNFINPLKKDFLVKKYINF